MTKQEKNKKKKGSEWKTGFVICPRLIWIVRQFCTYTETSTFLCKSPRCLLREPLHFSNSKTICPLGPAPGHFPPKVFKGGGGGRSLTVWPDFFRTLVLSGAVHAGISLVFAENGANNMGAFNLNRMSTALLYGNQNPNLMPMMGFQS